MRGAFLALHSIASYQELRIHILVPLQAIADTAAPTTSTAAGEIDS